MTDLDLTAVKYGYYRVIVNGVEVSKHLQERQKKFRERMVFWINASRVVGKAITWSLWKWW